MSATSREKLLGTHGFEPGCEAQKLSILLCSPPFFVSDFMSPVRSTALSFIAKCFIGVGISNSWKILRNFFGCCKNAELLLLATNFLHPPNFIFNGYLASDLFISKVNFSRVFFTTPKKKTF